MTDIPLSASGKTAMQVAIEVSRKAGEILTERFLRAVTVTVLDAYPSAEMVTL
ncbi:MAG: hypothetical protein QF898_04335 [SAR202 cluster bacterium]|nr:hypothetical protein [SAR202 cluster bacterium]